MFRSLGSASVPDGRYDRISIRERCVREVFRRVQSKEWEFATVDWNKVTRDPIPEQQDRKGGSILSMLDGSEQYGGNTQRGENSVELMVEFVIVPAQDETPITVLNLVAAEIVELLSGQHELTEGGDGTDGEQLAVMLSANSYEPDIDMGPDLPARGLVTLSLQYRTRLHKPFTLNQ